MSSQGSGEPYPIAEFDEARLAPYLREIFRHAMVAQTAIDSLDAEFAAQGFAKDQNRIFMGVQAFLASSGMISKLLWPVSHKMCADQEPTDEELKLAWWKKERGKRLRAALGVNKTSPLHGRQLRNALEHYDERLDKFVSKSHNSIFFEWTILASPNVIEHLGDHEDMPIVTAIEADSLYVRVMTDSMKLRDVNEEVQRVGRGAQRILEA